MGHLGTPNAVEVADWADDGMVAGNTEAGSQAEAIGAA